MPGKIETTACRVLNKLSLLGLRKSDIKSEHISDIYHLQRKTPGSPIFTKIGKALQEVTNATPCEPVWAVIVETRNHENLEFTVRNLHRELELPIQIFHGVANASALRNTLADLIRNGSVRLTNLHVDRLEACDYNALLLSPNFWQAIPARDRVLIFQTDSIICKARQYTLEHFSDHDLVGAYWPVQRPVGFVIEGGSGGLSVRNKHLVIECLERFSPALWGGGEDGFFGFHMQLVGGNVSSPEISLKFATQHVFDFKSLGAHKISTLSKLDLHRFLSYCPDAYRLLPTPA